VNAVADLGAEHVVDQSVLGQAREAGEGRGLDTGLEVAPVPGDLRARAGYSGLDPLLQLVGFDAFQTGHVSTILSEAMITLSSVGAQKVNEFLAAQGEQAAVAGLRVGVRGGGCSGFQYVLAFDEQRDGDQVFTDQGIRLLVDEESLPYVDGSTIDYVQELMGAGFKVENPNVVAACGCGSSFRVSEEQNCSPV
jgi:iron-sulfur cluster assembly protein